MSTVRYIATDVRTRGLSGDLAKLCSMFIDTPLSADEARAAVEEQIELSEACLENPGFVPPKEVSDSLVRLRRTHDKMETMMQSLFVGGFIQKADDEEENDTRGD